jgi:8-oxo-dGTP pyrophosphatase MutT (NUDIX family)
MLATQRVHNGILQVMNPPPISEITHHYAGVFLVTDKGKIIGQQRDNKPTIDNPNRIGSFGGVVESAETPHQAAWRELAEETNLKLDPQDIQLYFKDVTWRKLTGEWEVRHFYFARISKEQVNNLEVHEGKGWAYIKSVDDALLIDLWREPIGRLIHQLTIYS